VLRAAEYLRAAGRLSEAAELSAQGKASAEAAALYSQLGERAKAAQQYERAGDFESAMRLYQELGEFDRAVECAFRTGDRRRPIEVLEARKSFFEAARLALELDDKELAIRLLQRVPLRDVYYAESCELLAQLFFQREEADLALGKLDEAMSSRGEDHCLELREQIGEHFERQQRTSEALAVYETILKRDIDYPGMQERVEALRSRLAQAQAASARPAAGEPRESRYEILGEIGRGGMGVVYKARDKRLERVVALKRLPDNLVEHPAAVKLFLREAKSVAALNHPNVVTLFDADQENGAYYITMEFLDGLPVDKILRKHGRLSPNDAVRIGLQTLAGLGYAHARRIIHRDIKPSNLFFTREKQVKIMDFGLAKMVEEVRKGSSIIAGTPYYMAPEQALGEAVDHRADLYAFGVTLYQLLTGEVPFSEGNVQYHHLHTPPPDPRECVPELPQLLAELVLRLLAKRPEQRFESAAQVAGVLESLGGK
jgi:tRNA A-37 threonylcarbamoyl transferase component Bud32